MLASFGWKTNAKIPRSGPHVHWPTARLGLNRILARSIHTSEPSCRIRYETYICYFGSYLGSRSGANLQRPRIIEISNCRSEGKFGPDRFGPGSGRLCSHYCYSPTLQTVIAAETQINVSRSLSKMKSVFVTLDKGFTTTRKTYYNKSWNNF